MDAVVIGSGPNGLVAAATLARAGWRVLVLEAASRPGGACWSVESTLPGYVHDVGAAFFPFAQDSPAFKHLDLAGAGLRFAHAAHESCHPAPDGTCATISRGLGTSAFGADGPAWERFASWAQRMGPRLAEALCAPLPALMPALRLGLLNVMHLGMNGLITTAAFSSWHFKTEAARRVVPGLALHVDLGPDDWAGAGLGLVLGLLASSAGFAVPLGGARSISQALIRRIEESGGKVETGRRVDRILVRGGRAVAVRVGKDEIGFGKAVLADVSPLALGRELLEGIDWFRARLRRFRPGWGTFKMDWALSGPVPWTAAEARESAVIHAGDSVEDLRRFTRQVRSGSLPDNPYLVIGQQSLADPSRAPAGGHTLWAYSRVPSRIEGGWESAKESFADSIEDRIEGLAPGFKSLILGRAVVSPPDLEAMDENLIGGDLGGGSAQLDQQLFLRPAFPWWGHRLPVKGVYLCSASTHPGAGVHGACGLNAARAALGDAR